MIARVLPLTRTRAVRGLWDYRLPAEGGAGVGSLLRVSFNGRPSVAVVAELAPTSEVPEDRLVTAESVLPARLPADLVELAVWMAREYCSTPARALSVVLPAGAERGMREKRVLVASLTADGRAALHGGALLSEGQRAALEALAARSPVRAAELGTELLRRLERRGLVRVEVASASRRPVRHAVSSVSAEAPPLTAEQEAALGEVLRALGGAGGRMLLHGVTGSGKTEVYLRAAEAVLAAGRTVIILVPEIGLTPQALARFEARFGEVVAVMHSGMSDGARHDEWVRLAGGEARVCVGPRSAVFAPLRDIGLIVVDEEHESSYKHEGDPRYDARWVAEERARAHRALLVLGSATPRPESVHRFTSLRLTRRVDGRPLPAVSVLDMRALHHPLHPETRLALADVRRAGGKAVVLLNRRGWSNFLSCTDCGHVFMCPNCEVSLVLHRREGAVACHHCGHRARVPERCPSCGSVSLARHGAGTERLEHELLGALGGDGFPVLRLDADAVGLDARARLLERFAAAGAGVLVGTQMVAKGHDFADVSLGVVIDADQTLRFPDFRAEERTFSLITQLAGRAGRGGEGRVLVQTMAPEARCIQLAARHDSDSFVAGELARRRVLRYPPFATLVRIVCAAVEPAAALACAEALRGLIDPPGATVLGPAPLFAVRGRARFQLVIKATDRAAAVAACGAAVDGLAGRREHRGVAISVDVDPQ
ncbi:MAG TPA: primosomal protein N' [Solirubrobacteraceae bacterium]|nr:primosomal protein N' [Solirubrobacteraceae bacterium]